MSNKSGVSEQVISLPKGGGALHGIGEKFSPDLYTGTGNFSVPVEVPPGRSGFQPELTLTYSTGNGNGPFGLGWALSIPGVSLKTSKGVPRYQGEDTYVLSGAEDLVLVEDRTTASGLQQERHRYYRPRTEGLFARIVYVTGGGEDRWEVTSKSGLKSVYGRDQDSRLYDEDHPGRVFQWLLSETVDTHGNRIAYTYKREDGAGLQDKRYEGNHAYNQLYLSKIEYADYPSGLREKFLFSVEFDYGEYDEEGNPVGTWGYRPDPFSAYRAGFEIRTVRRCRRILIKVHEENGSLGGRLIKSYRLRYADELSEAERGGTPLPPNGASLLSEATLTGHRADQEDGQQDSPSQSWGWGDNSQSQLGDGTDTNKSTPAGTSDLLDGAVALAGGGAHGLALLSDGEVWSWGDNRFGQLGDGTTTLGSTPRRVSGNLAGVAAVAAGENHSLALGAGGTVWAWGRGWLGQLGVGTADDSRVPVRVGGLGEVVAVAAGKNSSYALGRDGTVWAWGHNAVGQLGDGTRTDRLSPVRVSGLEGIVEIAAGHGHALAVKSDGTAWAWGHNPLGQLGDASNAELRAEPVRVVGLGDVVSVAGGGLHSLALKSDGTVWAWGANRTDPLGPVGGGQLGDGTTTSRGVPAQTSGLSGVAEISAGAGHSLALKSDGTVWAWGANNSGQLGDGIVEDKRVPTRVGGLGATTSVAAGFWWYSMALTKEEVRAVGSQRLWEFPDGSGAPSRLNFDIGGREVVGLQSAGPTLTLASDGTVWARGANYAGQLGDGTTIDRLFKPARVRGENGVGFLASARAIAAGNEHCLALASDGGVLAWGMNAWGRLGDGTEEDRHAPVRVSGLRDVVQVAAGKAHSYALKSDGTVWAWGYNDLGRLGDGTGTNRLTPVRVKDLEGIVAIEAGDSHGLALKADGTVWAWGVGQWGQLGDGTWTVAAHTPVRVSDLDRVVAVAAGANHSLALRSDGTVWAWGANDASQVGAGHAGGQLGDGTKADRNAPVRVRGLVGIEAIAAGGAHSLALGSDGTAWAWGANDSGQLGDGTTEDGLLPGRIGGLRDAVAIAAGYRNSVVLTRQSEAISEESLPPLTFGYTTFEPEKRRFMPLKGSVLPARSLANPDTELVDLFGNGLPDILEMNGTVRYWRNLGNGQFGPPQEMKDAPAGLRLADHGVQLIDADGDGRVDLLANIDGLAGYYPSRFGAQWDRRSFRPYQEAPSFNLEDPEVRLVDLNGDGVTDVVRAGSRLECFFNEPNSGWNGTHWVERRQLNEFPNINFSDPRIKWADMTGDGLQDVLLVHDGRVEYWPSCGHGDWGDRVSMRHSPRFPYGYDPRRILVGDVDGDGAADIVYVEDTKITLWINESGNGWSGPITIHGTPPVSDADAVRVTDTLGTGVGGVLWSTDADGLSRERMFFLDFTGEVKPYLLNEMDNHIGSVTRVEYTPSTRFYLEDEGRPDTRWKTPLPFPVQVVTRVEAIDALSGGKLTTEYGYHHGHWDGAEREFRGFGRVDQRDTEVAKDPTTAFSPPLETRTWFHQGPVGDEFGEWEEVDFGAEFCAESWSGDPKLTQPQVFSRPQAMLDLLERLPRRARRDALRALRGRALRTELYAKDGTELQERPYTVTEHLYGVREEAPPDTGEEDRPRIFFAHALAERTTQWERGDDPMSRFTFTDDYDGYGQVHAQTSIAVPRRRDFRAAGVAGAPYLATHAVTKYAQRDDADRYIADRVASTTSYEIPNDGSPSVFVLHAGILDGSTARRVIGQALNFYDGPTFQGLPFGQLGDHGALVQTENLVLTEDTLHEAYKSGTTVLNPPEEPPYLARSGTPGWTPEYPQEFRDRLPALAGFTYRAGGAEYQRGYFATIERRRYDFQEGTGGRGRGLLKATRDPLGHDTTIAYDRYGLLPTEVTPPTEAPDAAVLTTRASYDYRVLQPSLVTEPNGNRTAYDFTPLGLLASVAVMGRPGEAVGDTPTAPGARMIYDFMAFAVRGEPISVRTVRRVNHANDADVPQPERDATIETVEYSDGFGRLLQTRTQAEDVVFGDPAFGDAGLPAEQALPPGDAVGRQRAVGDPPRVVVSGWQIYDNKGRVVEKYEPFFSTGWAYASADAQRGQKATIYYDPRGQVVRTVNPDGSEDRVIHGVPADLTEPERFAPTPWELYTYDANDNAGRTHPASSGSYQQHRDTPASALVDALGRTVETVVRKGPNPATDWYRARSAYDIRGNLLTATDELGRVAFRHVYDLADRALRSEQIDAGVRRTILDAGGNVIEGRDGKDALVLQTTDATNRPIRLWARDGAGQRLTLRQRVVYGDSLDPAQARAANLLGRPSRHYDEAGSLAFEAYDFKGNVREKVRRVISDAQILGVPKPSPSNNWKVETYRADWQPLAGTTLDAHAAKLLDATPYRTSLAYDALNRVKTMRYPQDVEGGRKELRPRYNRAGALERVELAGAMSTVYVERIVYNAKGQRTLVAYGNGAMTRHAYDPKTFRLVRMRTEDYARPAGTPLTYRASNPTKPLQDFAYAYDLAGNILSIVDRTPGCGVAGNPEALQVADPVLRQLLVAGDALVRRFEYDPLYRLSSAAGGRQCKTVPNPRPWSDDQRCGHVFGHHATPSGDNAPQLAELYRERYAYDPAGNMVSLAHQNPDASWTRYFGVGGFTPQQWEQEWPKHLNSPGAWPNPPGNRLTHAGDNAPGTTQTHRYDANGNLTREAASRNFEWDHGDRLRLYRTQTEGAKASVYAYYLYDAGGQRVKKVVGNQGSQVETTVYVDGVFEHHRFSAQEANTLHVVDNQQRIAMVRVGKPLPGDNSPNVRYHLGDHLSSSNVVADGTGDLINREEYTPYGETIFGSFTKKRYRFTGKERDEESGLYYHGARYYAPWLGRWVSCDPAGAVDGLNLYVYVHNNPVCLFDPTGHSAAEKILEEAPRWVPVVLTGGRAAAGAGAGIAGTGAAGAAAGTGTVLGIGLFGWASAAVASVGFAIYKGREAWQSWKQLQEATKRSEQLQEYVRRQIDLAWKNGVITDEEYLLYKATGNLVIQPRNSVPQSAPHAQSAPQEESTAAANRSRSYNQQFMHEQLNKIKQDPNHPLKSLVDPASGDWRGRRHGSELHPSVQAGHGTSFHSGAEERLFLEDADFNQLSSWRGERQGVVFEKSGVDINGVPVEKRTAQQWENLGLLPQGTVENAPTHEGWKPPQKGNR